MKQETVNIFLFTLTIHVNEYFNARYNLTHMILEITFDSCWHINEVIFYTIKILRTIN